MAGRCDRNSVYVSHSHASSLTFSIAATYSSTPLPLMLTGSRTQLRTYFRTRHLLQAIPTHRIK